MTRHGRENYKKSLLVSGLESQSYKLGVTLLMFQVRKLNRR